MLGSSCICDGDPLPAFGHPPPDERGPRRPMRRLATVLVPPLPRRGRGPPAYYRSEMHTRQEGAKGKACAPTFTLCPGPHQHKSTNWPLIICITPIIIDLY